eukprot:8998878-Prorocentrum_lima.AAC.1
MDGATVPNSVGSMYLGCSLDHRTNPRLVIRRRMSVCMATWKRLDEFWLRVDSSVAFKIHVWEP